jgi:hypothetical protein
MCCAPLLLPSSCRVQAWSDVPTPAASRVSTCWVGLCPLAAARVGAAVGMPRVLRAGVSTIAWLFATLGRLGWTRCPRLPARAQTGTGSRVLAGLSQEYLSKKDAIVLSHGDAGRHCPQGLQGKGGPSPPGSDIHGMPALRRSSPQVVVAEEKLNGAHRVRALLRKGQRLAYQA